MRFICVIGKFTGNTHDLSARYASDFLCPCRGIRFDIVVAGGAVFIVQTAFQTVVGHGQIVNGGHQRGAAICQLQAFYRQFVQQNIFQFNFAKVLGAFAAKIREADFSDVVLAAQQAELQFGFVTGRAVALFKVPFTFFTPTETN